MKSSQIEQVIASHLKKGLSAQKIFEKIKHTSHAHEIARFLYQAKLYKTLMEYSLSRLEKNKSVPWSFTLQVLMEHKVSFSKKQMDILFKHWLSQPHPSLWACVELEEIYPPFTSLKQKYFRKKKEEQREKKESYLEKDLLRDLKFVQVQGFIQEEERIIKKLLLRDPSNKKYQEYHSQLKEKWAKDVLVKKRKKSSVKNVISEPFVPEKNKIKDTICKKTFQLAHKHPSQSKNLSLFLYFMHWPEKAFSLLKKYPNKKEDVFFLLDWLMETNQHVLSLDYVHKILRTGKQDPDVLFLMNYKKSQILYALGKKRKAIEYLTNIIKIRPNYRSAQSLLKQWEENETL